MSNDHQQTQPPNTTVELHRQPPPSPTTPTPVSILAAAFGRAISTIPPTSFHDAAATTTTTTPPKIPRNHPLRRTLSDPINIDNQQTHQPNNITPLRRSLSDTSDFQLPNKTPKVSSSPQSSSRKQSPQYSTGKQSLQSSSGKQSPQVKRLRKIEDMVREMEQRCWEIMREEDEHVEDDGNINLNSNPAMPQSQGQEECVGVERLKNGDLRFELSCSCGKKFEMLVQSNGYCFYRLT